MRRDGKGSFEKMGSQLWSSTAIVLMRRLGRRVAKRGSRSGIEISIEWLRSTEWEKILFDSPESRTVTAELDHRISYTTFLYGKRNRLTQFYDQRLHNTYSSMET